MIDQILKDSSGHKIGTISVAKNNVQTIKDATGNIKGTYDPKTNITKNKQGHKIGAGNLLDTLL